MNNEAAESGEIIETPKFALQCGVPSGGIHSSGDCLCKACVMCMRYASRIRSGGDGTCVCI